MGKGQAEVMAVFGIIVVAVIAYLILSQQGIRNITPVTGEQKEVESIKSAIAGSIKSGLRDVVSRIYRNGGYYDAGKAGVETVSYAFYDVPVWYDCNEINVPDVEGEIKNGLLEYIKENFKPKMDFFGKSVTLDLDDVEVDVSLSEKNVEARVRMKTKVEGVREIDEYSVIFPTDIKKVVDFASDLTREANKTRFFENTLLTLLWKVNRPELYVLLNKCGETFVKTREEMISDMKWFLKRFPSHIVFGRNALASSDEPMYNVFMVNGKVYPDFDVTFDYPPGWEIENNFYAYPEPAVFTAVPTVPFIPVCVFRGSIEYSFRFPVVVRVEDKKEGRLFLFAVMANVEDNKPTECSGELKERVSEYRKTCMENLDCNANITVVDSEGKPVSGANVLFYICSLGKTNDEGRLEARFNCMSSVLKVMKDGYVTYGKFHSWDELENLTVVLKRGNEMKVHFYRVPVTGSVYQGEGKYESYSVSESPVELDENYIALVNYIPQYPEFGYDNVVSGVLSNQDEEGNVVSVVNASLYPVTYNFSGVLINNQTKVVKGYFAEVFEVPEGADRLNIYLPDVTNAEGSINATETNKLFDVVKSKCGGVVTVDEC